MIYFRDFMTDLANEHDLIKDIDGTTATMSLVLCHGTLAQVVFDEVNLDARSTVRSGTFVAPLDRYQRSRFMQYILHFNRNSLSTLVMGFMPDPANRGAFAPIWFVPKYAQAAKEWQASFAMYESLVADCSDQLRKMMSEWTANYLH